MILLAQPDVADDVLVRAAACDVPLLDYARQQWLDASRPEDPAAEPARVSITSVSPHWVSLDGERISPEDGRPWSVDVDLPAGKHLLQIGDADDTNARSAVLFELDQGERASWTVVPLVHGIDVLECGPGGWLEHRPSLAMADLGRSSRNWLSRKSGIACLESHEPSFDGARERAVLGAREGWQLYNEAAMGVARDRDPERWVVWQRRQLRLASVGRAFEVASLIGFGITEYLAYDDELWLAKGNELDPWAARASLMTVLTSTALRREALARGGHPTPKSSYILGILIASTSLLSLHRDENEYWLFSGGARTFGAILALTQVAQNEWSQRRARKRLRVEQGARR